MKQKIEGGVNKPEERDIDKVPYHMRADEEHRNENIRNNKPLCDRCSGTGNQLFSMYQKCEKCDGTGIQPKQKIEGGKKITRDKWVWMPHAGHFILGDKCQFHLNTRVGKYIVSTVGEYLPDSQIREIMAKSRGLNLEGMGDAREYDWKKKVGWEKIGCDRTYETMVFKSRKSKHKCCPYEMKSGTKIDMDGYNSADEAYKGHLALCEKYSNL